MQSQCKKAFLFVDFLFTIIPVLLMVVLTLNSLNIFSSSQEKQIHDQILLNKLISVSDYFVRYSSIEKQGEIYFPNKFSNKEFQKIDLEKLKQIINLEYLYIGFEQGKGTCIYRLILNENKIQKLYFCGE